MAMFLWLSSCGYLPPARRFHGTGPSDLKKHSSNNGVVTVEAVVMVNRLLMNIHEFLVMIFVKLQMA